ncbi:P-loop containing nucleoside triphosphate hydrolase protein [Mycena filopes]|nr:P-loop containing nucleoside triphosphate hydrolase protein [Mycena filopes]KAJ7168829.1 P-loop containing nucleoside triphosphate hydrolase protein [Mycena filopes]
MPFKPLLELDAEKLNTATRNLCQVFGVPALRPHQTETGQNILKGISTLLDIPTGGGKTLAYWFPLFYYWAPGNHDVACQKIVLLVGPLSALMQSQASSLTAKGIPAIAITSATENTEQVLKDVGENKYRVVLVSPEMAVTSKFHDLVLSKKPFSDNVICQVIDEGHCITEWGNDDFRPEFSKLHVLLARLPSGLPVVVGSATMPRDVILDVLAKLRLRADCARVSVSNEKPNIALSVRILQHPQDTFADLITLFPRDFKDPQDFAQSLIYAGGRMEVEKMQDVLRHNRPTCIPADVFKFYHRFIAEERKQLVQDRIENGSLRAVATTDALGMGMDFQRIMRVLIWLCPRSFLSLVQKIGRCVRLAELLGEAILYITSSAFMRYEIELEILRSDAANDDNDDEDTPEPPAPLGDGEQIDRDAAMEVDDEAQAAPAPKRKIPVPYPAPAGARCCDNCNPDLFPVDTIGLTGESHLKMGRRRHAKASEDLITEAEAGLKTLREAIAHREFPNSYIITGKILMSDQIIETILPRLRDITSIETLAEAVHWHWAPKYGGEVVEAIRNVVARHPDLEAEAREAEKRERALAALESLAAADRRKKLGPVFDACHERIMSFTRPGPKPGQTVKICQIFMALPRKTVKPSLLFRFCGPHFIQVWPSYYVIIKYPISIAFIKKYSHTKHVQSLTEYAALWYILFENAREFNQEGSLFLQQVLDDTLTEQAELHGVVGVDPQQCASIVTRARKGDEVVEGPAEGAQNTDVS